MDINKIFNLFKEEEPKTIKEFKEQPIYYLLLFKKTVTNYLKNKQIQIDTIRKSHPSLNLEDITKASDYFFYNKAYEYLLPIKDLESIILNIEYQQDVLEIILDYFEKIEEYEKCIIIDNIIKKIKYNVASSYI